MDLAELLAKRRVRHVLDLLGLDPKEWTRFNNNFIRSRNLERFLLQIGRSDVLTSQFKVDGGALLM